jgi:hypothetical protein
MASLTQLLHDLEARLMDPEIRRSDAASDLIADDFMEFGGNGRIFNKTDALAVMKRHAPRVLAMEEFTVRELSPTIALATYRVRSQGNAGSPGRVSIRSSIWIQRNGKWQVTFHQATIVSESM